jgi:hypothetical protein
MLTIYKANDVVPEEEAAISYHLLKSSPSFSSCDSSFLLYHLFVLLYETKHHQLGPSEQQAAHHPSC